MSQQYKNVALSVAGLDWSGWAAGSIGYEGTEGW